MEVAAANVALPDFERGPAPLGREPASSAAGVSWLAVAQDGRGHGRAQRSDFSRVRSLLDRSGDQLHNELAKIAKVPFRTSPPNCPWLGELGDNPCELLFVPFSFV